MASVRAYLRCVTPNKPVYVASDIHLGASPAAQERAFLDWLDEAAERSSRIIINGDLFDFWFEYRWGTTRGHERTLGVLKSIVSAGVPITLMGGNHDWWGGRFLREEIGLEFLQDPVTRVICGRRTLLAHGDGVGPGDRGYKLLKSLLRSPVTRFTFGLLPPALGDRVAGGVSVTEHRWESASEYQLERSEVLERWASTQLQADPELELIILGHTHVPRFREVRTGQWYVNTGDWVAHRTYLVLEEGRAPRLMEWGEEQSR